MLSLFLPISNLLQATLPHTTSWIYTQHNTAPLFSIIHNSVCLILQIPPPPFPLPPWRHHLPLYTLLACCALWGQGAKFFMLFLHRCFQTKLNSLWNASQSTWLESACCSDFSQHDLYLGPFCHIWQASFQALAHFLCEFEGHNCHFNSRW